MIGDPSLIISLRPEVSFSASRACTSLLSAVRLTPFLCCVDDLRIAHDLDFVARRVRREMRDTGPNAAVSTCSAPLSLASVLRGKSGRFGDSLVPVDHEHAVRHPNSAQAPKHRLGHVLCRARLVPAVRAALHRQPQGHPGISSPLTEQHARLEDDTRPKIHGFHRILQLPLHLGVRKDAAAGRAARRDEDELRSAAIGPRSGSNPAQ